MSEVKHGDECCDGSNRQEMNHDWRHGACQPDWHGPALDGSEFPGREKDGGYTAALNYSLAK